MATPNYSYEKRQKELAKKRKKEDKLKQKSQRKSTDSEPGTEEINDTEAADTPSEAAPKP
jgi:hypothetical protein